MSGIIEAIQTLHAWAAHGCRCKPCSNLAWVLKVTMQSRDFFLGLDEKLVLACALFHFEMVRIFQDYEERKDV